MLLITILLLLIILMLLEERIKEKDTRGDELMRRTDKGIILIFSLLFEFAFLNVTKEECRYINNT